MSYRGEPGGENSPHETCVDDGPVDAGRSVVEAVECNTARFVDLVGESGAVAPTYLVLTAASPPATSLTRTDVFSLPELQNALAYYGRDTDSVRVRTTADRSGLLEEHVAELASKLGADAFEFADCQFALDVVQG